MRTLHNTWDWLSDPARARRLALTVWWVLAIGILVRIGMSSDPRRNSVYPIFSNAAREWERGVDLYDRSLPRDGLDNYRYAPVVAACFTGLAWLPDSLGNVVWRLINGGVFLVGLVAFFRSVCPGRSRLDNTTVALLALGLLPLSLGSLNNGQPNALITGCLLLALAAIGRGRWWPAAICLAVPILFKVYPAAILMLLVLAYPGLSWRTALAVLVGCLLPLVLQDPTYVAQIYQSWVHQVSNDNRHLLPMELSYRDFHVLTRLVGWPMAEEAYLALQLGTAGLVALAMLRLRWLGRTGVAYLRAALDLGCCWIVLFGPATENCTYILLAPTMALAAAEGVRLGKPAWKRWWLIVMVSLFVASSVVMMFPGGRHYSFFLMPLGALLLLGERVVSLLGSPGADVVVRPLAPARPLAA
jgi:hypothetical protein